MRGRPATISDDDILNAARDMFLQRGLQATTAEIAQSAGISESIIFYRYKTKEALIVAVVERQLVLPPVLETLAERVGQGEIADQLYEVGTAILDNSRKILPFLMMVWASPPKFAHSFRERMRHPNPVRVRVVRLLAGYFEAEARLGRILTADPEIVARTFLGSIVDYVMSEHLYRTPDSLPLPAPTFLRGLVNILMLGIQPRDPPPRRRAR